MCGSRYAVLCLWEREAPVCPSLWKCKVCPPPPSYADCLCLSLSEYTVCPPPGPISSAPVSPSSCEYNVYPTFIRGAPVSRSLLVRGGTPKTRTISARRSSRVRYPDAALRPLPTPPDTPWAEEPSHSSPCCLSPSLGQKRLENPGAVGKSRSGCAAEPGLRLPRPRRQGPPARPPPNAQAPSWPGTAASATLPGPAQPCRRGR